MEENSDISEDELISSYFFQGYTNPEIVEFLKLHGISYRLTNWLMFLCGQIQSPRPDVMPDRREGIARAEGFVAARIETSVS